MEKKYQVLIRRCDDYDAEKIYGIIKEGMEELNVRPAGRILLKPNVVIAHSEVFPHAFTRKEFLFLSLYNILIPNLPVSLIFNTN